MEPSDTNSGPVERQLFFQALEKAAGEERVAFLDRACADNPDLRRRLEELLQKHEDLGTFLEAPAISAPHSESNAPEPPAETAELAGPREKPGDLIGRYKLLQQIGEGGCGVVYMAEQEQPVRRKVALKVIKLGMDTRQVVARFEAERQALALMDHPNIAKVLDAGATASGRPYFVMELVRGKKITAYCDQQRLAMRQRLDLFIQVCHAVQHAHQKGIIHRDIKPSNILVTERDGVPVPKVIDFGIVKATGDVQLTDKTLFTAFEQFMGTPAYMSPEQTRLGELDIDTRSDIYSLGVLLYELLTGKTPLDTQALVAAGLDEMRRIIQEKEPSKPSTRLTALDAAELASAASNRQVEGLRLIQLIRGDLDWIIMKCLEKDRTRRYETANGLLTDIERHFHSEPVAARPPSAFYGFQKMVKRHRLQFAAISAVAASLILGFGVSLWQFVQKSRAYTRTVAAESKERKAREKAQAVASSLAYALEQSQFQNAEEFFMADNAAAAVAHLARLMRQNPTNEVAAERLLSALTHRNFAFPAIDALKLESRIISVEFSSDGQKLLTAAGDSARIWDANTGRPLTGPLKHDFDLSSASFSPNGLRVVTTCGASAANAWAYALPPYYAQIWDATTGQPLTEHLKHEASLTSARFSPDGQHMITASEDGTVSIWDVNSGQRQMFKLAAVGPNQPGDIIRSQFSPDGQRVVTASFNGTVQVWDAVTPQAIGQSMKHDASVTYAEFSPDGQSVLTASIHHVMIGLKAPAFSAARVWDFKTGLPVAPPLQHDDGVNSARFSPDGLDVVTASQDMTARVWDAQTGQPLTLPLKHKANVLSAEFSSDGLRIVTASQDKTARVWDAKTGRPLTESLKHRDMFGSAHFSPNGQQVVTASDHTARIWDTRPRPILTQTFGQAYLIQSAHFSPDGTRVLTSSADRRAVIWDAKSGLRLIELQHDGALQFAIYSPDGSRVVTAVGGSARVWDSKTGRPLTEPLKHSNDIDFAQFSPDGLRVVTASQDFSARVWDAQTGELLTKPLQHTGVVSTARFSPDGLSVITASSDHTARLWDARTGRLLLEPLKHQASVVSAQFSPNGLRIVTASADNTAQVWDAKTGMKLTNPISHEDALVCAVFSPDGQRLATGSSDKTARLWDAITGQPLTAPLLHEAGVSSAQFSPDGLRLVTTCWDNTARVWDSRSGQPISEPLRDEGGYGVRWAEFSPDGERLVTVSGYSAHIREIPKVPLPVPDWVMDLAEAVSDNRLDEQGVLQPVPFDVLQTLRTRINESTSSDVWNRFAKWLFADPKLRPISPFSTLTMEVLRQQQEQQQLIVEGFHNRINVRNSQLQQAVERHHFSEEEVKIGMAKLNYTKSLIFALKKYAEQHEWQFPRNPDQAAVFISNALNGKTNVVPYQFEIVYQGSANDITQPANVILSREKKAWPRSDDRLARVYGFADGHAEIHEADEDGNFEAWEAKHSFPFRTR
jgi:WD40 repeat protein/serine/threonine protein kinase